QASDEKLRKARTVSYSSKIDPLRQGQRLDTIDQKIKHDSSKTGNARHSHARSRGKTSKPGAKTKAETPQAKFFPLSHKCNSPKLMHSQSPVHNKFFKKSNKPPPCSITSLKILPLVCTCTHQV